MPNVAATARRPCLVAVLLSVLAGPLGAQLVTAGSQFWDQGSTGIQGTSELGDEFGAVLASGDFNCDGFADLAIGVPFEDVNGDCDGDGTAHDNECHSAGAVQVIYGSAQGLHASAGHADQLFTENSSGMKGTAEAGDHFGAALAAVPQLAFVDDVCDDLVVGAPDEDIDDALGHHVDAGAVFHLHGSSSGLTPGGVIVQGRDGVPDRPEDHDQFGAAIGFSTFQDSDNCPGGWQTRTLVIGAPGEGLSVNANGDGTVIFVKTPCGACFGNDLPSPFCCSDGSQPCEQLDAGGTQGRVGASIAWGNRFVAVGAPDISAGGDHAGNVRIDLRPTSSPFRFSFSNVCQQGVNGAAGSLEDFDQIAEALAAGDFDGDGGKDIAAGVPFEDVGSTLNAGAVSVFYSNGASGHPTSGGPPRPGQLFDQDDTHFDGAEASDHFGEAVASGDFDGDGRDDLAIGVPDENIGGDVDAGMIHVLYGSASGLGTSGDQAFDLDDPDIVGDSQPKDHLGQSLAAGDFDGDGRSDLAIGAPGLASDFLTPGGVFVLYGGVDADHLDAVDFKSLTTTLAESAGTVTVTATRTGSAILPLTVTIHYFFTGTASPADLTPLGSSAVQWNAGEKGDKTFSFSIVDDDVDEPSETLEIGLDGSSHCLDPANRTITIVDNDQDVAGTFHFSVTNNSVSEDDGTATITIERDGGTLGGASVHATTADGTAHAGFDYVAKTTVVFFAEDQLAKSFNVTLLDDSLHENLEKFTVTLSNPSSGGTLTTPNPQNVQISDDGDTGLLADGFESGSALAWSFTRP